MPPLFTDKGKIMDKLLSILKDNQLSGEQIMALLESIAQNPIMAVSTIQQLDLPFEQSQQAILLLMQHTKFIQQAVNQLDISYL